MSWRDLLEAKDETIVTAWVGGNYAQLRARRWAFKHLAPREAGWYRFVVTAREVVGFGPSDPAPEQLFDTQTGYLVGDRFVDETVGHGFTLREAPRAHLIEPGLERFARICAGRAWHDGSLIFVRQEMPIGPEDDIRRAFEDQVAPAVALTQLKGVPPALYAALTLEHRQREETARRRAEAERRRREAEERQVREAQRAELVRKHGDGQSRRELAKLDFESAARAALNVGGAEYLDHRHSTQAREFVVNFRIPTMRRRFQCVVDDRLGVIDAGICLTAHWDDPGFEGGTRGDAWLTLESLPSVIRQAEREGALVVLRARN